MNQSKKCSRCKEEKPVEEFSRDKRGKFGRDNYCKKCRYKITKKYKQSKEGKENHRNNNLIDKYGISQKDYDRMFVEQDGKCAICGTENFQGHLYSKRKVDYFSIDHDHETGKVRGLLCLSCNIALGNFRDSIELLKKSISYLEKNRI